MTQIALSIVVEFETDAHLGVGRGKPGDVDAAVRIDRTGLPFLPRASLWGVWREQCERLASGLAEDHDSVWWEGVARLLGSPFDTADDGHAPFPTSVWGDPLRMEPAHASVVSQHGLTPWATVRRSRVEIDDETRVAKDHHLRIAELIRCTTRFESKNWYLSLPPHLAVDESDVVARDALSLLTAGALMIDRLGGTRRRGIGRCRVQLQSSTFGLDPETVVDRLRCGLPGLSGLAAPASPRSPIRRQDAGTPSTVSTENWTVFDIRLTARTPLAVGGKVLGNLETTEDHVPGSVLIPPVLEALTRAGVPQPGRLMADGLLVVLPAYIEAKVGRSVPAPLTIVESPADRRRLNLAQVAAHGPTDQLLDDFAAIVPDTSYPTVELLRPSKAIITGNTHDNTIQRPVGPAGVHVHEVLDEGSVLRFEIWIASDAIDEDLALNEVWSALDADVRIGHDRRGGDVGQATFEVCGIDPRTARSAEQFPVWITLESPLLLDELAADGGATTQRLVDELSSVCGIELTIAWRANRPLSFIRSQRLDRWHAAWGLPSRSLMVLRAGSTLKIEPASDHLSDEATNRALAALAHLELVGLGARRAEGLGRIAVNSAVTSAIEVMTRSAAAPAPVRPEVSVSLDELPSTVRAMQLDSWRDLLVQAARSLTTRPDGEGLALGASTTGVSDSQLGELRARLKSAGALSDVAAWCASQLDRLDAGAKALSAREFYTAWRDRAINLDKVWVLFDLEHIPDHLRVRTWPVAASGADLRTALHRDAMVAIVGALVRQRRASDSTRAEAS